MKGKHKIVVSVLVFLIVLFTSFGYAALNTKLSISGEGYVRADGEIRITDVKMVSATTESYETYNNKYSKDTTSMFMTLAGNGNIIYEIEVTNNSDERYILTEVIENNDNSSIICELIDIKTYDSISPNSKKRFQVKCGNNSNVQQLGSLNLEYKFEMFLVTPPTIKGGNNTWTKDPVTISLAQEGTSTVGIKNYEYYLTRKAEYPSTTTLASGTTDNEVNINTNGIFHIYYRTVANDGTKSSWSNGQKVYYDYTYVKESIGGSFDYRGTYDYFCLGDFQEIDSTNSYKNSITIKTSDASALYYAGLCQYDVDYLKISDSNIMYILGSTTYLTRNLKDGDTVVYLNNVSGFQKSTLSYQLGFIIWNYTDSTGYTYPKETYSRNSYNSLFSSSGINVSNNTITLNKPWQYGTVKAGTYLSQKNSSSAFHYGLLLYETISTNYQTLTNTLQGYGTILSSVAGSNPTSSNKFWPGTKYVKTLLTHNYGNYSTQVTTNISNFSITKN